MYVCMYAFLPAGCKKGVKKMSERSDFHARPRDKDGKNEEEEAEKAQENDDESTNSLTDPTIMITAKPSEEDGSHLPLKKRKLGPSLLQAAACREGPRIIVRSPAPRLEKKPLFGLEINCSDRLIIPAELAANFFPSLPRNYYDGCTPKEETLLLTDSDGRTWRTKSIYYGDECAFMLLRGWPAVVNHHSLKPLDFIQFHQPPSRLHGNHFLIQFQRTSNVETSVWVPEFKPESFLFRLRLTPQDVGFSRLVIPGQKVRKNFPAVRIPAKGLKHEILRFTDPAGKDWYMILVFAGDRNAYMIIDGWENFVRECNLEAMDVIKFFKPDLPSHSRHFLIDFKKRLTI